MNDLQQDKIDRYVLNQMTGEEKRLFEADLANDRALREDLELTRLAMEELSERAHLMDMMEQWDRDIADGDVRFDESRYYVASAAPDNSGLIGKAKDVESERGDKTELYDKGMGKGESKPKARIFRKWYYWASGVAAVFIIGFYYGATGTLSGTDIDEGLEVEDLENGAGKYERNPYAAPPEINAIQYPDTLGQEQMDSAESEQTGVSD